HISRRRQPQGCFTKFFGAASGAGPRGFARRRRTTGADLSAASGSNVENRTSLQQFQSMAHVERTRCSLFQVPDDARTTSSVDRLSVQRVEVQPGLSLLLVLRQYG